MAIALSYFDRYLSFHESMNENLIQLVAFTSLYLAIKIHSTRKLSIASISRLVLLYASIHTPFNDILLTKSNYSSYRIAKGCIHEDQILKMEIHMMKVLGWHLNPPTTFMYLDVASPLIYDSVGENYDVSIKVNDLTRYLLELSTCDGYFVQMNPSSIAVAAIAVAMDINNVPRKCFLEHNQMENLYHDKDMSELCSQRIRQVYDLAVLTMKEEELASAERTLSPTTVEDELLQA